MAAAGAARDRSASAGLLSIGQVLARLTPEFPQLTSSKLRFLEVQGIVTPSRTESGYRKFSASDVERLRAALTLQRDHYLPLSVIREQLDEAEAKGEGWGSIAPPSPPTRRAAAAHGRDTAAAQRCHQCRADRRRRALHRPGGHSAVGSRHSRQARHRAAPPAQHAAERRARGGSHRVGPVDAAAPHRLGFARASR